MDAADNWAPGADAPTPPTADPRLTELLLDALKAALTAPGEHRLFRSGKLAGLFPSRAGASSQAALHALKAGLLETVRTETRGKLVSEWVKSTPKAVAFVNDHDSPASVLKELKALLDATRAGIPLWMVDAKAEVAALSARFQGQAAAVLTRLDDLAARVEAALRRAEANAPGIAEPVGKVVPWAIDALEYLDRRVRAGSVGECPLPELFHAIRVRFPELTLSQFQDGLQRLHDTRAVRLSPASEMAEPEYAVVVEGRLMYGVRR
jgi:hypothetical protein